MPQAQDALKGAAVSVHEMLVTADRRFRVPEFQRHYVWRADGKDPHIGRFWADIERLRNEGLAEDGSADSLFLGAIVLQTIDPGGPGSTTPLFSIIDGQQRLTTLYLVFTAIAEAFQDAGQPDKAADIERQYLLVQASRHKEQPRLEPTMSDTAQFYKIISCLQNPVPRIQGLGYGADDHFMFRAWQAIRQKVRELCVDDGTSNQLSVKKLEQLHEDIAGRIELVSITLGTRHDVHEVYERLNTAGERLGHIDLVRNAVFLTAGHDSDPAEIYRHWEEFEDKLGKKYQDGYFFPYALIRDHQTTNGSLYRSLKDYWEKNVTHGERGIDPAIEIIKDLNEYLPAYRGIVGDREPSDLEPVSRDALQRLERLNPPTMTYPYLMQLLHAHLLGEVSSDEFKNAVGVIDSFIIRRSFAGIGNTGIHMLFKRLWSSENVDSFSLTKSLEVRTVQFPSDDQFFESVKTASIYDSRRCRYILTEYERSIGRGDPSEWNPSEITVDHLMPRNPTIDARGRLPDWPGVTAEGHSAVVDTFANLVPLSAQANSQKSTRSWSETKKMMTEESGTVFKSTRAVFDEYDQWDLDTIAERAERLAQWALDRWPKHTF